MDANLSSQRHLREVFQRLQNIEAGIAETKANVTSAGLRNFASAIQRICDLVRSALQSEVDAADGPEEIEEIASRYDLAIHDLHSDAFDFTTTELIRFYPNEMLPALQFEIGRFEAKATLILHPYSGNSYKTHIYEDLFQWYQDVLLPEGFGDGPSSEEIPKWFVFFSYPKGEAQNFLLHLIMLSHEVMHLRDIRRGLVDSVLSQVQVSIDSDVVQRVAEQIAATPIDRSDALLIPRTVGELYSGDYLRSVVVAESNAVIDNWLREIVADMLAARLYGPAYLEAFSTLSRALGVLNVFSNTHPSSFFRIGFIVNELQDLGYKERDPAKFPFEHFRDAITYWESRHEKEEEEPTVPYHQIARSKIRESVEVIRRIVRQDTGPDVASLGGFVGSVGALLGYLRQGIPPGQILTPAKAFEKAQFSVILNAAWYFYVTEIETLASLLDASPHPSDPRPLQKLNQLVAKAFEASQLL